MQNEDSLKALVAQGLQALLAGSQVAKRATAEIQNDASHPELKEFLKRGEQHAQQWEQRLQSALREVGDHGGSTDDNPVLEAHYEVSRRIRGEARDGFARDLGIVAAGQLALHYWIASMGTLRTYAERIGMREAAQNLQASLDEAKEADQGHTDLAARIMDGAGGGRRGMGIAAD